MGAGRWLVYWHNEMAMTLFAPVDWRIPMKVESEAGLLC